MKRLAVIAAVLTLTGCGPPSIVPSVTVPWILVFAVIGGFVLFAYIRKEK